MNTKLWEQVKELLDLALKLAPAERSRFLDEACSSDKALRAEVESLLLAGEDVRSSFMQSPAVAEMLPAGSGFAGIKSALEEGQIFAEHFLLARRLGEGGMGQVWLAEQFAPVQRQVALKLIKAGMYDETVVERFQAERQSLAIMDHPAIAKVFEAGTTAQGQPYFVMEYVPGLPITEYCDQKKLKIRERLELFIQACDGVQHAHQKAVIHRDLKPANILVVEVDGKPTPRIIDFGLARAAAPRAGDESLLTQLGYLVGTPGYMSPEQAGARAQDSQDIDTRTDVYSLGVVLYVLLAGSQPFELAQHKKQSLDEMLRQLREEEPPRPSSKVTLDRDSSAANAEARGTEPKQLVSQLRGDLDWITMKALEKERDRRYGTPSELAADLERYLNHLPVLARPASARYQVRKYVRRHRVGVGMSALLVLLLAAFTVVQAVQLRRITEERDRANRERDRATRVTDFMTGMFKVSDPYVARGNTVTAREILDKASKDLGPALAKDPEVQSQLMQVMARTYVNLGLYPRAYELAKGAMDSRMSQLGPNDPKTLESMTLVGWILNREGRNTEAEKMEREALDRERNVLGPEDAQTLETLDNLAVIVEGQGHFDEQEKLEREVIEASSRRLGPEDAQTLRAMDNLGTALWNEGRYPEADQEYRQLLETERRVWGPDHPETIKALGNLALTVQAEGHLPEAEQLYRQALAGSQRVLGPENEATVRVMGNLATLLCNEGRLDECEKLHRESMGIQLRTLGAEHPDTLFSKLNLADVLLRQGHISEAEKLQRETLETQIRVQGAKNPDTLLSESDLARTMIREGRYEEGEKLARDAFENQLHDLGPDHPDMLNSLQLLGMALADSHRYPQATRLFHEVIEQQSHAPNAQTRDDRWQVWYDFACVAAAAYRTADALQDLQEAVDRGYTDADALTTDDDLKSLRKNPQFLELVAVLRHPPAKAQPK